MSDDKEYQDGDVVWVKLGNNWWPSEVTGPHRQPEGLVKHLKRKPYCVVKFFNEDTYEYVRSSKKIFHYQCIKKDEFIKRGYSLYNGNNKFMEKFPADVEVAERLIRHNNTLRVNDRPDSIVKAILGQPLVRSSFNDAYTNAVGTIDSCPDYMRRSGDSVTKILNLTPQQTSTITTSSANTRSSTKARDASNNNKSNSVINTRTRTNSANAKQSTVVNETSTAAASVANFYQCNMCDFTSVRQNVMILHRKMHSSRNVNSALISPDKSRTCTSAGWFACSSSSSSSDSTVISSKEPVNSVNDDSMTTNQTPKQPALKTLYQSNHVATSKSEVSFSAESEDEEEAELITSSWNCSIPLKSLTNRKSVAHKANGSNVSPKPQIDYSPAAINCLPKKISLTALALRKNYENDCMDPFEEEEEEERKQRNKQEETRKKAIDTCHTVNVMTPVAPPPKPKINSGDIFRQILAEWTDEEDLPPPEGEPTPQISQPTPPQSISVLPNRTVVDTKTSGRIRNIPKKDRRDVVLQDFNSDFNTQIGYEATTNANIEMKNNSPQMIVNVDSSNCSNSSLVEIIDDEPCGTVISIPDDDAVADSEESFQPTSSSSVKSQSVWENNPNYRKDSRTSEDILSCFDFQEEEEDCASMAHFKKKYLSTDKNLVVIEDEENILRKATEINKRNEETLKTDRQLVAEIESLLEQTALPIAARLTSATPITAISNIVTPTTVTSAAISPTDTLTTVTSAAAISPTVTSAIATSPTTTPTTPIPTTFISTTTVPTTSVPIAIASTASTPVTSSPTIAVNALPLEEEMAVKGLPIKERGKRIFKSRNRSRFEELGFNEMQTSTTTATETSKELLPSSTNQDEKEEVVVVDLNDTDDKINEQDSVERRTETEAENVVEIMDESHEEESATNKMTNQGSSVNDKEQEEEEEEEEEEDEDEDVVEIVNSPEPEIAPEIRQNEESEKLIEMVQEVQRVETPKSLASIRNNEIVEKENLIGTQENDDNDHTSDAEGEAEEIDKIPETTNIFEGEQRFQRQASEEELSCVINDPQQNRLISETPTDENSSLATSDTEAEFGSPTSMLDEERLPTFMYNNNNDVTIHQPSIDDHQEEVFPVARNETIDKEYPPQETLETSKIERTQEISEISSSEKDTRICEEDDIVALPGNEKAGEIFRTEEILEVTRDEKTTDQYQQEVLDLIRNEEIMDRPQQEMSELGSNENVEHEQQEQILERNETPNDEHPHEILELSTNETKTEEEQQQQQNELALQRNETDVVIRTKENLQPEETTEDIIVNQELPAESHKHTVETTDCLRESNEDRFTMKGNEDENPEAIRKEVQINLENLDGSECLSKEADLTTDTTTPGLMSPKMKLVPPRRSTIEKMDDLNVSVKPNTTFEAPISSSFGDVHVKNINPDMFNTREMEVPTGRLSKRRAHIKITPRRSGAEFSKEDISTFDWKKSHFYGKAWHLQQKESEHITQIEKSVEVEVRADLDKERENLDVSKVEEREKVEEKTKSSETKEEKEEKTLANIQNVEESVENVKNVENVENVENVTQLHSKEITEDEEMKTIDEITFEDELETDTGNNNNIDDDFDKEDSVLDSPTTKDLMNDLCTNDHTNEFELEKKENSIQSSTDKLQEKFVVGDILQNGTKMKKDISELTANELENSPYKEHNEHEIESCSTIQQDSEADPLKPSVNTWIEKVNALNKQLEGFPLEEGANVKEITEPDVVFTTDREGGEQKPKEEKTERNLKEVEEPIKIQKKRKSIESEDKEEVKTTSYARDLQAARNQEPITKNIPKIWQEIEVSLAKKRKLNDEQISSTPNAIDGTKCVATAETIVYTYQGPTTNSENISNFSDHISKHAEEISIDSKTNVDHTNVHYADQDATTNTQSLSHISDQGIKDLLLPTDHTPVVDVDDTHCLDQSPSHESEDISHFPNHDTKPILENSKDSMTLADHTTVVDGQTKNLIESENISSFRDHSVENVQEVNKDLLMLADHTTIPGNSSPQSIEDENNKLFSIKNITEPSTNEIQKEDEKILRDISNNIHNNESSEQVATSLIVFTPEVDDTIVKETDISDMQQTLNSPLPRSDNEFLNQEIRATELLQAVIPTKTHISDKSLCSPLSSEMVIISPPGREEVVQSEIMPTTIPTENEPMVEPGFLVIKTPQSMENNTEDADNNTQLDAEFLIEFDSIVNSQEHQREQVVEEIISTEEALNNIIEEVHDNNLPQNDCDFIEASNSNALVNISQPMQEEIVQEVIISKPKDIQYNIQSQQLTSSSRLVMEQRRKTVCNENLTNNESIGCKTYALDVEAVIPAIKTVRRTNERKVTLPSTEISDKLRSNRDSSQSPNSTAFPTTTKRVPYKSPLTAVKRKMSIEDNITSFIIERPKPITSSSNAPGPPPLKRLDYNATNQVKTNNNPTATIIASSGEIYDLPALLNNEQLLQELIQTATPTTLTAVMEDSSNQSRSENAKVIHQQIIQGPPLIAASTSSGVIQQKQKLPINPSTNSSQRLTKSTCAGNSKNKQIGTDSRGNKYLIIKTPATDPAVHPHIFTQTPPISAMNNLSTNSLKTTSTAQQQHALNKPKSTNFASGRKQQGSIITLPSALTLPQRDKYETSPTSVDGGTGAMKSSRQKLINQRRKSTQLKPPLTSSNATSEKHREAMAALSRRLSINSEAPPLAKIPRTSTMIPSQQVVSNSLDQTSKILAVPTQAIPGYNETFLLCTLVDNTYKPIDNVPLYLDHDLNQLVPVPFELLKEEPQLIVNHPIPSDPPSQQTLMQRTEVLDSNDLSTQTLSNLHSATGNIIEETAASSSVGESMIVLPQQLIEETIVETNNIATDQMTIFEPNEESNTELVPNNALILNIEGQQFVLDGAIFAHLLANPDANTQLITDEGTELMLTREVLAALQMQHETQTAVEMSAVAQQQQQQQQQMTVDTSSNDILAVALAGSELYGSDVLEIDTSQDLQLIGSDGCIVFQPTNSTLSQSHLTPQVSETNALLDHQPIMSTLESPSSVKSGKSKTSQLTAGGLTSLLSTSLSANHTRPNLEDSLAAIGVTTQSSTVPSSLDLPITVTNPNIAPKVNLSAAHTDMMQFALPRSVSAAATAAAVAAAALAGETRLFSDFNS
uniref:C2H2-type domain-containing protein n=1 Tax=Glossina brevipalpis TaxID=37001 RepID=A0A1A9WM99_9MUSC